MLLSASIIACNPETPYEEEAPPDNTTTETTTEPERGPIVTGQEAN